MPGKMGSEENEDDSGGTKTAEQPAGTEAIVAAYRARRTEIINKLTNAPFDDPEILRAVADRLRRQDEAGRIAIAPGGVEILVYAADRRMRAAILLEQAAQLEEEAQKLLSESLKSK